MDVFSDCWSDANHQISASYRKGLPIKMFKASPCVVLFITDCYFCSPLKTCIISEAGIIPFAIFITKSHQELLLAFIHCGSIDHWYSNIRLLKSINQNPFVTSVTQIPDSNGVILIKNVTCLRHKAKQEGYREKSQWMKHREGLKGFYSRNRFIYSNKNIHRAAAATINIPDHTPPPALSRPVLLHCCF